MKRIFTLLIIVFGGLYCNAQDYVPLVREGVKWKCGKAYDTYWAWSCNKIDSYTIYFEGDTIIEDHSYKNCMLVFDGYPEEISDSTLCGFAREDIAAKKVYFRWNPQYDYKLYYADYNREFLDIGAEFVLYDFSDVTQCSAFKEKSNLTVEIENVNIAGNIHRQHNIKYSDGSHFLSMIEGIGCIGNHSCYYLDNTGDLLCFFCVAYSGTSNYLPMFFQLEDADGNIIYDAPNDEHIRLAREGVKWKYTRVFNPENPEVTERVPFTLEMKGDTILHAQRCKNVIWTNEMTGEQTVGEQFMIEDIIKKLVYVVGKEEYNYPCLYSFNDIASGRYCGDVDVTFMQDSTIMLGDVKTVCHKFDYGDGRKYSFIEGVGFVNETPNKYGEYDGNILCFLQGQDTDASYYDVFECLEDSDGNVIYTAPKSPYRVDGIETVGQSNDEAAIEVARYDVHGRRLTAPMPGINIIKMSDGTARKVITR